MEKPLTEENIMKDEVEIPEALKEFYKIFYTVKANELCSAKKSDMTGASSTDANFTCPGEKLTPEKHLSLGLTLKSLTESKVIAFLLNCFGHCASDETIWRIDLDLEKTVFKTTILVPNHIIRKSNLSTGLSWDKFDINMETSSGENLIHHTYAICYQNTLLQEQIQTFEKTNTNIQDASISHNEERKICHIKNVHPAKDTEWLELCWKKPRLAKCPFLRNITMIPNTFTKFKTEDLPWVAAFNNIQSDPMWTRWNTREHTETSPQQLVSYMKHIQLPPTGIDVVKETL